MNDSMTARLMDVKRFAVHDGPGIRTTLFLKGCSLRCVWCHNPEGISAALQLAYYAHKCISCGECAAVCPQGAHSMTDGLHRFERARCRACGQCVPGCLGEALQLFGRSITVEEAAGMALEDRVFYEQSGGGVTLSGGEPLLQADFCAALAEKLRAEHIATAIDTCGCVPWDAFEKLLPLAEIFLFDVKQIDPDAHKRLTGQDNRLILENLRRLSSAGARIEIRMPLVPGANDDEATLQGIGRFLQPLSIEKMRVLPYHSMARSKYAALGLRDTMPDVPSPDDAAIERAVRILQSYHVPAVSGKA